MVRLDAAWGSPRLAGLATGLVTGSGGDRLLAFPAAGGDDRIPPLPGGDDGVQLPEQCRGEHCVGLAGG